MRFRRLLLRVGSPFVQLWFRLRKPATFGVKALIRHPDGRFLVVRHSYADTRRWSLPGGGYTPDRETPAAAAAREIHEELSIQLPAEAFSTIATTVTTLEGKQDTLTIVQGLAHDDRFRLSPELAEARWITGLEELGDDPLSRSLLRALN